LGRPVKTLTEQICTSQLHFSKPISFSQIHHITGSQKRTTGGVA
jgi:hypothetical protein